MLSDISDEVYFGIQKDDMYSVFVDDLESVQPFIEVYSSSGRENDLWRAAAKVQRDGEALYDEIESGWNDKHSAELLADVILERSPEMEEHWLRKTLEGMQPDASWILWKNPFSMGPNYRSNWTMEDPLKL